MTGRPDFSQPGSQGSGQTVAVQNRPELKSLDLTQTGSVSASTNEVVEVYAPTSSLYKVQGVRLKVNADATATSGTHSFTGVNHGSIDVWTGSSTFDTKISYTASHWWDANNTQYPDTDAATLQAVQSMKATENTPIRIRYYNGTDAAQDNQRIIKLVVAEDGY